jgi:hypothetical protein
MPTIDPFDAASPRAIADRRAREAVRPVPVGSAESFTAISVTPLGSPRSRRPLSAASVAVAEDGVDAEPEPRVRRVPRQAW